MYPEFRIPFDPIECMENNRAYLRRMLNIHSEAKWEARARDILRQFMSVYFLCR